MGATASTIQVSSSSKACLLEESSFAAKHSIDMTVSIHESDDARLFVAKNPQIHKEVIRILSHEENESYTKLFAELDSMQRRTFSVIHCVTKRCNISITSNEDEEHQACMCSCDFLTRNLSFIFEDVRRISAWSH